MLIQRRFDEIFTTKTHFETLDQVLKRLHRNKSELLLVLSDPSSPYTPMTASGISAIMSRNESSAVVPAATVGDAVGTPSPVSLGVSFWEFLLDRVSAMNRIPPLPSLIRERAAAH
jgi:hypothetical protein